MKRNILFASLLFGLLGIVFTSCSKDDDNVNVPSELIGTWQEVSLTEISYINGVKNNENTSAGHDIIVFESGGKASWEGEAKYSYSVGKLTITYADGDKTIFSVTELTNEKLVLSDSEKYTIEGKNYESVVISTYKKIQ